MNWGGAGMDIWGMRVAWIWQEYGRRCMALCERDSVRARTSVHGSVCGSNRERSLVWGSMCSRDRERTLAWGSMCSRDREWTLAWGSMCSRDRTGAEYVTQHKDPYPYLYSWLWLSCNRLFQQTIPDAVSVSPNRQIDQQGRRHARQGWTHPACAHIYSVVYGLDCRSL